MSIALSHGMFLRLLASVLSLSVLPSAAFAAVPCADGEAIPVPSRPEGSTARHGAFASLGLFSALGFGGLSYAYAPSEQWLVETGLGYGLTGIQLSSMPKWSLGRRHRLVIGLGPSLGIRPDENAVSVWLNGDVGYEVRADNGVSIFFGIGFTKGLAGCIAEQCRPGGAWAETDSQASVSERAADHFGPQTRVIIGKWF